MHAFKSCSNDLLSNGTENSKLRLVSTTTSSEKGLKNWKQESLFLHRTDYHHALLNTYGRYMYYIHCESDTLCNLGFVCFNGAKEFASPTKTTYTSLESAKIAAEEHYKKNFI